MSEEKLYAVKDDEGLLLLYSEQGAPLWRLWGEMFADKPAAERAAHAENGHVVALIEEPEKVVLSEKQAEIVEDAHVYMYPAKCITDSHYHTYPEHYIPDDTDNSDGLEELLMNAYVNGYTVKKEKKYNVKVPHVSLYYWEKPDGGIGIDDLNTDNDCFEFTESEIEHYGLQDCEKEEVTDDGIR